MKEVIFMKIMIESSINSHDGNILTNTSGILNNNKLFYKDNDDILVTLWLNQDNILLWRESKDYKLIFDFSNNRCTYISKDMDKNLDMNLSVLNMFIENNNIEIKYRLEDNEFLYKLNYEVKK